MVPPLHALPKGCKFVDRCGAAIDRCRTEEPALVAIGAPDDGHRVRCHAPVEVPT
jgi:peptide/nickel transport system ATP-binding protein